MLPLANQCLSRFAPPSGSVLLFFVCGPCIPKANLKRSPSIITSRRLFTENERAQLFTLVYDYLAYQQQAGGPMMGAMFWNVAIYQDSGSEVSNQGYNIYL